jgi:predicted ArsR family transcriptional regulator
MADMQKIRRETIRWNILLTLNNAQPLGAFDSLVLSVIRAEYLDATQQEVRRELDYLSERDLVKVEHKPNGQWFCKLKRYGVDVVEYTVDCEPGIARPEKYYDA